VPAQPANTIENNLETWSRYDWSRQGEEWSNSEEWKASLVRHVLEPNIPVGSRVLEIGPGGGRWTELLLQRGKHVTAVDLTPECIAVCRERFKDARNIEYQVNDGRDLGFVPTGSIDRIWSFDVFVHIQTRDVENYVAEFPRILVAGGVAVIHHAKSGRATGWRSDMTDAKMRDICQRHGLEVVAQFDSWDQGRVRIYDSGPGDPSPDVMTILTKPS
jgi:SAM-dependent methyltransferase